MDVCTDGRCHSSFTRSPTEIKMKLCYPLITRRPATSYTSRQAFSPSPRIHSASPRIAMATTPRSNVVSTAGFYDWSTEETGDVSMTNIYRKLAVNHKNRLNRGNKNWCTDGIHVNPGRMFIRDKADLTKGEREIIAGIYKNRGDVYRDSSRNGAVTQVKSHTDAWLIGKQISKKGGPFEVEKCSIKIPDTLFSKNDSHRDSTDGTESANYICETCKDNCLHHKYEKEEVKIRRTDRTGMTAPPSSPTHSPKTARKPKTTPRINNEGGVFVESGKTFIDPQEGSKKKKVFVDVFLPKFPTQAELTNLSIPLDKDNDAPDRRRDSASRKSHFGSIIDTDQQLSTDRSQRNPVLKMHNSRATPGRSDRMRKSTSLSSSRSNSSAGD